MPTVTYTFLDRNDDEITVTFPVKWEICYRCHGNGTHDHPAFSNGITSEQWEYEWDQDDREAYLSGRYDVVCSDCDGSGKVKVIDEDMISADMQEDLDEYYRYCDRQRAYERECEAERRMGA